jgi:hypothetical protein
MIPGAPITREVGTVCGISKISSDGGKQLLRQPLFSRQPASVDRAEAAHHRTPWLTAALLPADHMSLVGSKLTCPWSSHIDWVQLKKSFTGSTPQGASVMQLPFSLVKAMPASVQKQLAERSGGYEDKLRMLDGEVVGIFDPLVISILEVGLGGRVQRCAVPAARTDTDPCVRLPSLAGGAADGDTSRSAP